MKRKVLAFTMGVMLACGISTAAGAEEVKVSGKTIQAEADLTEKESVVEESQSRPEFPGEARKETGETSSEASSETKEEKTGTETDLSEKSSKVKEEKKETDETSSEKSSEVKEEKKKTGEARSEASSETKEEKKGTKRSRSEVTSDVQKETDPNSSKASSEKSGRNNTRRKKTERSRRQIIGNGGQAPGANGEMPENAGQMPGGQGGPGSSSAPTSFDAANTLTEDSDGTAYSSTTDGQNAVLVDGQKVTITNASVDKTGDSSGEDSDFYGTNAAVLANNSADVTLSNATITTDGTHANGVFSYGTGTTVNISDSTITTTGNNSGGIMTTGGATMNASNLTVNTSGNSSAAIRSDRGGGTVTVSEGSYTASGVGSPAIYSTADISVSDATLSAGNSEAVVIEGGNSVTLENVDITGNNATLNGQSTTKTNVLIYQSMSGDAADGNSTFTMTGGSMTSETGTMFHVTNVTTEINLSGVEFTYADDSSDFMILSQDSWGKAGSNGGNAAVNMSSQSASGDITVDTASSLKLSLADNSDYSGAINGTDEEGDVSVSIEDGSTWTLTGDSYISSFDGDYSSVNLNGYTLYVNGTAVAG